MSLASVTTKPNPSKSVFINFPFDDDFDLILNAIFFTAVCCGFVPRSALEWNEEGGSRLPRIMDGLVTSKYSIHDLSRYRGEGEEKLARFNMPLELGMAVALSHVKKGNQMPHRWLALVPEGDLHHKVISDLSGYDQNVKKYDGTDISVARKVFTWLSPFPDAIRTPPAIPAILSALGQFHERARKQKEDYGERVWGQMLEDARQLVPLL